MTNKRYTDEEIISSLEVIATTCNCNECKIRNGKWGACNCSQTTANAALDLIDRQRAEIEKMKGSTIVSNIMESQRIKREAKAEAYKEFAERLKEQDGYDNHVFDDCASILVPKEYLKGRDEKIKEVWTTIDNLVKEMVGKNNV